MNEKTNVETCNPFSKDEKENNQFFKQMTSAINDWMLKQYPAFDTELINKIEEIRILQHDVRGIVGDFRRELDSIKEKHKNYLVSQIDQHMSKNYPDIKDELKKTIENLDYSISLQNQTYVSLNRKLKKLGNYRVNSAFKEIDEYIKLLKEKMKEVIQ